MLMLFRNRPHRARIVCPCALDFAAHDNISWRNYREAFSDRPHMSLAAFLVASSRTKPHSPWAFLGMPVARRHLRSEQGWFAQEPWRVGDCLGRFRQEGQAELQVAFCHSEGVLDRCSPGFRHHHDGPRQCARGRHQRTSLLRNDGNLISNFSPRPHDVPLLFCTRCPNKCAASSLCCLDAQRSVLTTIWHPENQTLKNQVTKTGHF